MAHYLLGCKSSRWRLCPTSGKNDETVFALIEGFMAEKNIIIERAGLFSKKATSL
jgi:hypothetical protein